MKGVLQIRAQGDGAKAPHCEWLAECRRCRIDEVFDAEDSEGAARDDELELQGFSGDGPCTAMIKNIHNRSTEESIRRYSGLSTRAFESL